MALTGEWHWLENGIGWRMALAGEWQNTGSKLVGECAEMSRRLERNGQETSRRHAGNKSQRDVWIAVKTHQNCVSNAS